MTTRSNGPWAGFGWLQRGISVGFRHPKPLLGGASLLVLACFMPSLIALLIQYRAAQMGTQPSLTSFGVIMAVSMLLSLLIVPLYAGYMQVIEAAEQGLPARARDIFKPYRQGDAWRLIGYGLALVVVFIAMFGIVIATVGHGVATWYMELLAAQASHQPLPTALPTGFGITLALIFALYLFMMAFYAISLGQVALRQRSVFGAIGDGLVGALKNLLPMLVLLLSLVLAWLAAGIAIVLVALLLSVIAKLVGAWLMIVLIIPLYIAFVLILFAAMFGVMYHLWRDVCGDDVITDMAPAFAA